MFLKILFGQQLSSIIQNCRSEKRSTINNNYQQLTEDKIGQQLTTIINNCDDHEWSTIINNYPKLVVSNKKRK